MRRAARVLHRRRVRAGAGVAELLVWLGLAAAAAAVAGVATRRAVTRASAVTTARAFAGELRLRRSQAIGRARSVGLAVTPRRGSWWVSVYEDGDGDGIRADDVARGTDPRRYGPVPFSARFGSARPGFLPGLRDLESPPPSGRALGELVDPVRFGSADVITFGPRGHARNGTLYLTDGRERQLAVVLHGASARVRVWEYDAVGRCWRSR